MGLNAGDGPSGRGGGRGGDGAGSGYTGGGGTWGADDRQSDNRGFTEKPRFTASAGGDGGGGGNGGTAAPLTVVDPSFHPSWVAKAAAEAKANQSFAGKKTTFDD